MVYDSYAKNAVEGIYGYVTHRKKTGQDYAISWHEPMAADGFVSRAKELLDTKNEELKAEASTWVKKATDLLESAIDRCEKDREVWYLPGLKRTLGECYFFDYTHLYPLATEKIDLAIKVFEEAIRDAESMQAKWLKLEALVSYAEMMKDLGRLDEILQRLAELLNELTEGFGSVVYQRALALISAKAR